jgi:hypothetical protein
MEAADASRPMTMVFAEKTGLCFDSCRGRVRYRRGEWNETALRPMKGLLRQSVMGPAVVLRAGRSTCSQGMSGLGVSLPISKRGGWVVAQSVRPSPDRDDLGRPRSKLAREGLRTADELFAALRRAGEEFHVSVTDRLLASFPRRWDMAIAVPGKPISQPMSSHVVLRRQDIWQGTVPGLTRVED